MSAIHWLPLRVAITLSTFVAVSAFPGSFRTIAMAQTSEPAQVGRVVYVTNLPATAAWKAKRPGDEYFIFRFDTATGALSQCGDARSEKECVTYPAILPAGQVVGRFTFSANSPVTAAWKSTRHDDEHFIFRLDTATGALSQCGDATSDCVGYHGTVPYAK